VIREGSPAGLWWEGFVEKVDFEHGVKKWRTDWWMLWVGMMTEMGWQVNEEVDRDKCRRLQFRFIPDNLHLTRQYKPQSMSVCDSLNVVEMCISPPQSVRVVVDRESVRPAKPRVYYYCSQAAVHASTTNAWRESPVTPEQISDRHKPPKKHLKVWISWTRSQRRRGYRPSICHTVPVLAKTVWGAGPPSAEWGGGYGE